MSCCDFSRLILLLSAICIIKVLCNTTLPTDEGDEDLGGERCSFVHLDTYTRQVETTWTSSNISSTWEKLQLQGSNNYVTIGYFNRKMQNAQWDFEIELDNEKIMIRTNFKMLERDETLNKIRIQAIADIGSATKMSTRFSDLDWYHTARGEQEFTGYSFIWLTKEEFGNMSHIISLNVTAELIYAKAMRFEALDCHNNQSMSAGFAESNDTSQGFTLPLPINPTDDKIRTIYEWTIHNPHLEFTDVLSTSYSYSIAETGGFSIGYDDDGVRWNVNMEILKFNRGQEHEVFLDIYDHSSSNLLILKKFNVSVTLVRGATSRKMDLSHYNTSLEYAKHFTLDLAEGDLKEWEDSLTVVMTFDPVESNHSTTDAYFR